MTRGENGQSGVLESLCCRSIILLEGAMKVGSVISDPVLWDGDIARAVVTLATNLLPKSKQWKAPPIFLLDPHSVMVSESSTEVSFTAPR